jgi:hypothetical protein
LRRTLRNFVIALLMFATTKQEERKRNADRRSSNLPCC